jgi:lipopolysaccharide/colanic/teichoic acid biosynthesis glycosyltransferase
VDVRTSANGNGKDNGNGTRPGNGHGRAVPTLEIQSATAADQPVLDEASFHRVICLERKRTERSRKPFLLMLLDAGDSLPEDSQAHLLNKILNGLTPVTRETDVTGWYKNYSVVGLMFTEIVMDEKGSVLGTMLERVSGCLRATLPFEQFNQIRISFHIFPEEWDREMGQFPNNRVLYPELIARGKNKVMFRITKRAIDIIGSLLALVLFLPVFALIAMLVKLSSRGPVIFCQERLGQFGKAFTFYKFRTMYVHNDARIHQEFMKGVINGASDAGHENGSGEHRVYKMIHDPRITRIGRLLRRLSFDELPQFINVLKGDMSLVGPRPPIAYEYFEYDLWHRRRLLEAKPGITGLWQVGGRSRIRFDDMVRLDLRYGRTWSPWLDIRILARTPGAVLFGHDAF